MEEGSGTRGGFVDLVSRFRRTAAAWLDVRTRQPSRSVLGWLVPAGAPLDLQILGRTLLHSALVGVGAGFVGAAFFAALEIVQYGLLERLAGYVPLRAYGEKFIEHHDPSDFRPWLLAFLPALGGLACGFLTRFAPEIKGGGANAAIRAFHHQGGAIRRRVLWLKTAASILTLGTGGSGGREGPTMHIGGALGSFVGRVLAVSPLERRVLMVAGIAAGISAVFRTPLGAALLAVEVLYRDDFEAEALVPAILASVISYSVVISIYGESILFARAPSYAFVPAHLPLYALLAIAVALLAVTFVKTIHLVERTTESLPVPPWARPALGGLAVGVIAVPIILFLSSYVRRTGAGLGIFGGGYGAAQVAITGSPWLPEGWAGVGLLLFLCAAKLVATSLTIGTGGSAGDFGPSLVLGGLFGGAFGRAAQLLLHDTRIDPGAFALVGMGTFYGGIAHVPVSALILVSELAGSYDLLVPLMLGGGIAFVALRNHTLYEAQVRTRRESPVHRGSQLDVLSDILVESVVTKGRPYLVFCVADRAAELRRATADATWQTVFPVRDGGGALVGLVATDVLRVLANEHDVDDWAIAADLMQPIVTVRADADLRTASELMLSTGLHQIPVVDANGEIVAFLDEAEVTRAYLDATTAAAAPSSSSVS